MKLLFRLTRKQKTLVHPKKSEIAFICRLSILLYGLISDVFIDLLLLEKSLNTIVFRLFFVNFLFIKNAGFSVLNSCGVFHRMGFLFSLLLGQLSSVEEFLSVAV